MNAQRLTGLTLKDSLEMGKRMSLGDCKAREELILSCIPLVKSMANNFINSFIAKNSFQCHSTFDDVFQDGMLGVLEAVDRYDYEKNVNFITYAYYYIHKRICNGIEKQTPLKISRDDFYSNIIINSTIKSFQDAFNVPPTNSQISELTSIPLKRIEFLRSRNFNLSSISFDENDAILSQSEQLPSGDLSFVVEKTLQQQTQKEIIDSALEILSDDEREIIEKRYLYQDKKTPLKELASLQGVCFQMIAKREKKALKKLLLFFVNHNISFDDLI